MYLLEKIRDLNSLSQKSVQRFSAQYDAFSVFVFVFYLANPFKWQNVGTFDLNPIAFLRFGAVILWVPLVFWRRWPERLKTYLPLFWHFSLFYHLSFRTAFSTFYSQQSNVYDSFGLLGIVALAVLVDSKEFCLFNLFAMALVALSYVILGDLDLPIAKFSSLFYAVLMVFAITFIKLIFFRNYNLHIDERCKAYRILAGAIAHEVRSPICTVNIACENLQHASDTKKNELMPIIKRQTRKALTVIDSILLQVGYIENTNKTKKLALSLRECIEEVLSEANFSELELKRVAVKAKDCKVLADKILLVQVLLNLVKNSLVATNNLENVEIFIDALKNGKFVNVSVFDNGIGISHKHQKQLFYPFLSRSENGAGIGLAFCHLAVKNMGGSISCESEPGKFTRFTIELESGETEQALSQDAMPALTKKAVKLA